jgi:hypothetical protein
MSWINGSVSWHPGQVCINIPTTINTIQNNDCFSGQHTNTSTTISPSISGISSFWYCSKSIPTYIVCRPIVCIVGQKYLIFIWCILPRATWSRMWSRDAKCKQTRYNYYSILSEIHTINHEQHTISIHYLASRARCQSTNTSPLADRNNTPSRIEFFHALGLSFALFLRNTWSNVRTLT